MAQHLALVVFAILAVVGLISAEDRGPRTYAIAKPLTTLSLLLVTGWPAGGFGTAIVAGLVLSVVGDIALLRQQEPRYFVVGLGAFLLAHLAYAAAFLGPGGARVSAAMGLGIVLAAIGAGALLRHIWSGVGAGLKVPVVAYGVVISGMVGAASAFFAGTSPVDVRAAALAGAVLFYFGDTLLALGLFGKPFPLRQTASMALYWAGQLGFALAARWAR